MNSNDQRRGSSSSNSSSTGKPRRRSRRPRSVNLLNINVAEARRQVCQALLVHRKSAKSSLPSSSSSSSSSSSRSSSSHDVVNGTYSTQLLQSMPLPEPVWSTTAPSLPPQFPYSEEAADVLFEWGENQTSSYTWWMAFLKSLDGNISTNSTVPQELKYPLTSLGCSNWYFGQRRDGNLKVEEAADEQIISPDEWLIIPTTESHEGEFKPVIP